MLFSVGPAYIAYYDGYELFYNFNWQFPFKMLYLMYLNVWNNCMLNPFCLKKSFKIFNCTIEKSLTNMAKFIYMQSFLDLNSRNHII